MVVMLFVRSPIVLGSAFVCWWLSLVVHASVCALFLWLTEVSAFAGDSMQLKSRLGTA